jgi:hypothetical protein
MRETDTAMVGESTGLLAAGRAGEGSKGKLSTIRVSIVTIMSIGTLALLSIAALYTSSAAAGSAAAASLPIYGSSAAPPASFSTAIDKGTGLTGVYGLDGSGSYRLFARGEYLSNVSGSNWNYLNIENTRTENDKDYTRAMRAVGYLEGYLTCADMRNYYLNFMHGMFEGSLPSKQTQQFLAENYKWVSSQADAK